MKWILPAILVLLSINWTSVAQTPVYQNLVFVSTAPSGSCTNGVPVQVVISTGALYSCQAGTWGGGLPGAGAGAGSTPVAGSIAFSGS